jgi:hypothetical protein
MGADKNSSRRRWRLQQDKHDFQHTSPTHYPSWPSPRSHWSATRPRNQQTTFRAKTHQHAQRKLARLAACATPVRPMACAGQTGEQRWSGRWLQQPQAFQKASVTSLGPGTKSPQNTTCTEGKPYRRPNKTPPNRPRTDQHHQDPKTHESSSSPEANPTKDLHRSDRSRAPVRPV